MVDEAPTQDSGATAAPKPAKAKARRSMFEDRTVRMLGLGALGLVIFYLVLILSALFTGVLNSNLPKTSAERDLTLFRTKVEQGSKVERDWAAYAQALTDAKQYDRAQTIIDQAKKAKYLDPRAQHLALAQTRLEYAKGDWNATIKAADVGLKALEKQYAADLEVYTKQGKASTMIATGRGDNYYTMMTVKGLALEKLDKDEELVKLLDAYLKDKPRAADMLEWRGDVHARLGDTKKAAADYKEARRYLGLETAAIDEKLEKLGVSQ